MEKLIYSYEDDGILCHHSVTDSPRNDDFAMHAHATCEIYCFIGGSAEYLVEGTEYELRPGDVMIMRGSETHRLLVRDGNVPYERIAVNFEPSLFSESAPELLEPFFDRPLGKKNRISTNEFESGLYLELIGKLCAPAPLGTGQRLAVESALTLFLVELRAAFDRIKTPQKDGGGTEEELIAYVNRHLFDDISLSGVSDKFYLSKTHINRIFKNMTGSTLWNYVRIKRLIAAREKIRAGASSVATAAECGYSDYSAFYRAYVSRFGSSPKSDR